MQKSTIMKKKATKAQSMKFEKESGEKQYNPPIPFKVKPQLPEKVIRGGSSRSKGKC
jgi:hypothetical protein